MTFGLALALLAHTAQAAPPLSLRTPAALPSGVPSKAPSPEPSPSPPLNKGDRLLWNHWYTITVNGKIPYSYYNERTELRNGRVFYRYDSWKSEEGYVNEEQLGALSETSPEVTPLFFNYHSSYRSTEIKIDGTVDQAKGGRVMTVKVTKGPTQLQPIRRNLPSKAFFSSLFPVWLGKRLPELKPGKTVGFLAIPEDSLDQNFSPAPGTVRLEPQDEYSKRSGTFRVSVTYRDLKSTWYVDKDGAAVKLEMPSIRTVVERVSKEKAQRFLEE